ncbi:hypothetical protein BDD43_2864 [Mucilaginibacter gracilis]|uniref:Uncharacterized protein n=1 Tax=Mucilaginibacter gracilis TaxID=423350 RepID=A0A495J3V0_9SPHI|nr:hypothetical protein [Mucilaginibacter gracilis]RKR82679.1 hypothetical protein BDD43_2864 [Mucilaginibacter gracilis]
MKKYLLLFVMALSMSAAFAINKIGDGPTLTGYIGDAMCAAKGKANTAEHAACAAKCIKGGSAAVLVVGDKVYKISNQKEVTKYAGKKVTVEGKVTDDTIEVTKVTEVKA